MTTKTGFLFRAVPRAYSLTVCWDKPETAGASDRYRLCIGDRVIDGIDRTFAVIDGLDPDTEYSVELSLQRRTRTDRKRLPLRHSAPPSSKG
ncbi:fibronectin type III domain-containing protein [Bifidobacterium vespertilionis]|uniref:fibronectin type III domain-containing protein n=1 Tax=Bifidobacterium vespertilionis TaxID=2562524 RepID=UPI001BDC2C08|nr:fibronectin type III domain-containing protein [Bifidobacterium vespertilionis]MBT1179578.1 fibronectin type III domain-containing protein [Bifidobacterium vespertilionis]